MTVQELINKLNEFTPDEELKFFFYDDIECCNKEAWLDSIENEDDSVKIYIQNVEIYNSSSNIQRNS